jgi:pyridoxamine 5'-phosphate oxidase family protein
MSVFTDKEIEYMAEQHLGRLATVDSKGNPHVAPVGFRYNPVTDTIDIGGLDLKNTRKWHHAAAHPRVAFVIDDVVPPWQVHGIEVRADVELIEEGGKQWGPHYAPELMRLHPVRIVAWGLDTREKNARDVAKKEEVKLQP